MVEISSSMKRLLIVQMPNYSFFVVFIISIVLTWQVDWLPWSLVPSSDLTNWWRLTELVLGYICTVIAVMFITWGVVSLSLDRAMGKEIGREGDSQLIKRGAYSYCRHPITLGFVFATPGVFLIFDFVPLLLTTIIYTPIMLGILVYEERELVARFGDEYVEYKRKTRFLIPVRKSKNQSRDLRESS